MGNLSNAGEDADYGAQIPKFIIIPKDITYSLCSLCGELAVWIKVVGERFNQGETQ